MGYKKDMEKNIKNGNISENDDGTIKKQEQEDINNEACDAMTEFF